MPSAFAEGGFELLPEEWQVQCLDLPALLAAVESASAAPTLHGDRFGAAFAAPASGGFGSAAAVFPGFVPPPAPRLSPALQASAGHRRVAALLLDELDRALAFLRRERLKLAAGFAAAEALAAKYAQSCKRLPPAGATGGGFSPSGGGDPYLKARLKGLLVELYAEQAQQVAFRMCNHAAVQRVVARHAERAEAAEASAAASGGAETDEAGRVSVAKGFALFAMSHALFAERLAGSDAAASAASGVSLADATADAASDPLPSDTATEQPAELSTGARTSSAGSPGSSGVLEVSELEMAQLYAALFCHGDLEVARAALAYHHAARLASAMPLARRRGFSGLSGRPSGAGWARAEQAWWAAVCLGRWCGGGGLCGALSRGGPFGVGLRLGTAGVLLGWVLWDCLVDDDMGKEVWHDPAFKVYRGLGNLILLLLCWGVDLRVWQNYGIDYERFLRMPPARPGADPAAQVWNVGLDLCIAFLLSLICFWKALRGVFLAGVPPTLAHTFPLALFLYVAYRAVTPWKDRKDLFQAMREVVVAPFGSTAFKEGFAGDVFTSAVRPLTDLAFAALYFLSGAHGWAAATSADLATDTVTEAWAFKALVVPAVTLLPLWWRFCQCLQRSLDTRERWPHLGNAMKYATSVLVSCYGLAHADAKLHAAWLGAFVFATLYQFAWDIFMDWDLVRVQKAPPRRRKGSGGGFRVAGAWEVRWRSPLLYRNRAFYATVAAANLVLRFCWALTLIPEGGAEAWQNTIQVRLSPWLAGAEVCRRCVWAFLRLENEHLATYGTAVDDLFGAEEASNAPVEHLEPMQVRTRDTTGKGADSSSAVLSSGHHAPLPTEEPLSEDDAASDSAAAGLQAPPHGSGSAFLFGVPSSTAGKAHNEVLAELICLAAVVVTTAAALVFAI